MALLLGFSTQIWWVTTRGGVWHTGHLVATILTLFLLAEMFGRKRAVLMGLLVGAAFLTRAPLAFAAPAVALWLIPTGHVPAVADGRHRRPGRGAAVARVGPVRLGVLPGPRLLLLVQPRPLRRPARVRLCAGDAARRGSRTCAIWACSRPAHIPMNLDYLFWKTPALTAEFPYFRPDGLGMSVLITSPALLLARPRAVARPPVVVPADRRGRSC